MVRYCNLPFPSVKLNIVGLGRPYRYSGPSAHPSNLVQPWYTGSSAVVADQRPLISFTRCAKILERIDDIRQFRPGPSPSPRSPLSTPPPPADLLPGKAKAKVKEKEKTETKDKDRRRRSPEPGTNRSWTRRPPEQFETRVAALAEIGRQMQESHEVS